MKDTGLSLVCMGDLAWIVMNHLNGNLIFDGLTT